MRTEDAGSGSRQDIPASWLRDSELNPSLFEPHWPPVRLRVAPLSLGNSNEKMVAKHQHTGGGQGRRPVSCLSSLSFKFCPSPLFGWPRPPLMTSLGALPKCCPTAHSWLNTNKPPGQQHSPPSQAPQVAPWVPHLPRVGRGKKERVNPGGLLENLSYKKGKGWTEEKPPGSRETVHMGAPPVPTQGREAAPVMA